MIFGNLSIFQNILFLIACMGILLMLVYIICILAGAINKKNSTTSDDIDNSEEDFKETRKFIYNSFTIKGSILFLAITASIGFFLSLFINIWLALVIGAVVAVLGTLAVGYLDREELAQDGEIAIVSETIQPNQANTGKVIVLSDGAQLDAKTNSGKELKKGKKVIITEKQDKFVLVKKFKGAKKWTF